MRRHLSVFLTVLAVVAAILVDGRDLVGAEGPVTVIDGDSLIFEGKVVQLAGIDAPELGQRCLNQEKMWRCGLESALALRKMISFGEIACTLQDDAPAMAAANCAVEGKDLATALLQQGYAVALADAGPTYQAAQETAREAKFGLWRGDFVEPARWRAGERLAGEPIDTQFCVIKGVIHEEGQRVFYVPSDEAYDRIEIDPARGERMFCSDDQAILRGWKPFPKAKS